MSRIEAAGSGGQGSLAARICVWRRHLATFLAGAFLAVLPADLAFGNDSTVSPELRETMLHGRDDITARVQFGFFGMGSVPEDMTLKEVEGEAVNLLSYEELVECIRQEIAIRAMREDLQLLDADIADLEARLVEMRDRIRKDRLLAEKGRLDRSGVTRANALVALYNEEADRHGRLAGQHGNMLDAIETEIVAFSVSCTQRPFRIEDERLARHEIRGIKATRLHIDADEPWPMLEKAGD